MIHAATGSSACLSVPCGEFFAKVPTAHPTAKERGYTSGCGRNNFAFPDQSDIHKK